MIHPTAIVEDGVTLGLDVQIWHHCHIRSGASIGDGCVLGKNVYIDSDVLIGDRCKIQNNVSIYRGVFLGDDVFCGPSMVFTNDHHPRATEWREDLIVPTYVQDGASIGANATIVCGVTIGRSAMIGAGSVVTKDVESYELVYGNPARHEGFVCTDGTREP